MAFSHSGGSGPLRIGAGAAPVGGPSVYHGYNLAYIPGEGFKAYYGTGGAPIQLGTNYTAAGTGALSGVMSIEWDGATITAKFGDTVVASGPANGFTGTSVAIGGAPSTATRTIDNMKVETL